MLAIATRLRALLARRTGAAADVAAPAPSRQTCQCGAELVAPREDRGRIVRCPNCAAPRYVLAASRWPAPHGPAIDWEPAGYDPEPVVAAEVEAPAREPGVAPPADDAPAAAGPDGSTLADLPEQVQAAVVEQVRRRPLRWIALGAAILIAATGYFSIQAARRRTAAAELGPLTAAGARALADGDYTAAVRVLDAAARAAEILPGDSPAERRAVQLAAEAHIWARLSSVEPAEFFLARARGSEVDARAGWPTEFEAVLGGRTIVLDAWVCREHDADWAALMAAGPPPGGQPPAGAAAVDGPRLRADWSLVAPPLSLHVVLPDDPAFAEVQPGQPRRVVFGARLAKLRPSPVDPTVWLIELAPGSCVALTAEAPLVRQGWPLDDAGRALLADQARRHGGVP